MTSYQKSDSFNRCGFKR